MDLTLQYFDDCPNWQTTASHLRVLVDEGIGSSWRLQRIATPDEAERVGFRGSPTLLIDGRDPFAEPDAPVGLACRIYRVPGGLAGTPTLDQIRGAIGRHMTHSDRDEEEPDGPHPTL